MNVASWEAEANPGLQSDFLRIFFEEIFASSILEHWARLLLRLASCEGSQHAPGIAAGQLDGLYAIAHFSLGRCPSDHADRLLACSPCLTYFLTSQLVALCADLDGGTVYGMPDAPGSALFAAMLARPAAGSRSLPIEDALRNCSLTFNFLSYRLRSKLQLAKLWTAYPGPAAVSPRCASSIGAADGPAAGSTAETAGVHAAAAGEGHEAVRSETERQGVVGPEMEGQEAEQERQPGRGAAAQQPDKDMCLIAAAEAGRCITAVPLVLKPAVFLEISLRIATALCRPATGALQAAGPAQAQPGSGAAGYDFRVVVVTKAVDLPLSALDFAQQLMLHAPSAATRQRQRGLAGSGGGSGASAAAVRPPRAPTLLERWWEAAVAVGNALCVAVTVRSSEEMGRALRLYCGMLWPMASMKAGEPPPHPSESVAAALSAGFLPCLARLLCAVMHLPLASDWANCLGWDWCAAWARMLAVADADQTATVIDVAAEGLRKAAAASAAASCRADAPAAASKADSGGASPLLCATSMASRLAGSAALELLPRVAAGAGSEPGTQHSDRASGSDDRAGCDVSRYTVWARLGGSLSLIAARLLPEQSRALLGGVLPLFRQGLVKLDTLCIMLAVQLEWVPTLAAALASESGAAAAAAAAAGASGDSGHGGSAGSGDRGGGGGGGGGGSAGPGALGWRQLLLVGLRLPGLLGVALALLLDGDAQGDAQGMSAMRAAVLQALRALAALVPSELARVVAAADRAEAAAVGRVAAECGLTGASAGTSLPPPPSSALLRRALGPGGPLEEPQLLAAVEAACGGGAGAGSGSPATGACKPDAPAGEAAERGRELLPRMRELLQGARLLRLLG